MQIEIKTVNKILSDLSNFYNMSYLPKGYTLITEEAGENGEYHYIIQYSSYYIRLTKYSDSYGNKLDKNALQFVTPLVKTVTDYSPI